MAGGIYKYTVDNTHIRRVDDDDGYIDGWWVGMGWDGMSIEGRSKFVVFLYYGWILTEQKYGKGSE